MSAIPSTSLPRRPILVTDDPRGIQAWFEAAILAELPVYDGSLAGARLAATAYARRAKAENTRRAYRAGVRAWCDWSRTHDIPCLPAHAADIVAFLAAERGRGLSVQTVELRRAAIRYLHFIAGHPVPTAEALVAETMAGIRRTTDGKLPRKALAATSAVVRDLVGSLPNDLAGLRDRALMLVGFAGALRRAELAAIRVEHLEPDAKGLRLTLPSSKGERMGRAVAVALPFGQSELCPVRALQHWLECASISSGPVFRRIRPGGPGRAPRVGDAAIDPGTVARILKKRAGIAGYDPARIAGHSLKRGALSTGMMQGVHPTRLKRLGRHKSYASLDEYLETGDPFESHPLSGVL